MAFASGLFVHTFQEMFRATALTGGTWDLRTAANFKLALHSNTLTPDFSAVDTTWANTNEVSGTGWATGGILLSTIASGGTSAVPTVTESPAGSLMYDHTNDVNVANTTLVNARGCIIYEDAVTAPTDLADMMVVAVNFGADYSTTAGTFAITWAAGGVFAIDLVP